MTLKPQPQTQPKPHRFTACNRHPTEPVTGFCALCLRERLSGLDPGVVVVRNTPSSSSSLPELRRCKTFSGIKGLARTNCEPQRKSCDVRAARNSLSSLFHLDDGGGNGFNADSEVEVETRDFGVSEGVGTVVEARVEENDGDEIRVFGEVEEEAELKTMKEFIDLECRSKKQSLRDLKDIAGSIWIAAKKLHLWRRKQAMKKPNLGGGYGGGSLEEMELQKANGRHLRETQSEIGDYGFGRRSCDTDPRFSIDGGRMSLDGGCPRYSFDEPRASWDGYMIGRALPRLAPMISVVEDVNDVVERGNVNRLSTQERDSSPGGSVQTRDYYTDPSNRRRRSFDQLGLYRKAGVVDFDEMRSLSNAKVSPTTVELFHGAKVLITERDLNTNPLKDDCLERDSASKDSVFIGNGGDGKDFKKYQIKGWRKAWSIWGLLHKRGESKNEDAGDESPANSTSKGVSGDKIIGSSSSVSSTGSCKLGGSVQSMRNNAEIKGHGNKRREHLVLERNKSARYSPNNLDNGLLRFYLTPLRSTRSRGGKSRLKNSHSIARNFLRFY